MQVSLLVVNFIAFSCKLLFVNFVFFVFSSCMKQTHYLYILRTWYLMPSFCKIPWGMYRIFFLLVHLVAISESEWRNFFVSRPRYLQWWGVKKKIFSSSYMYKVRVLYSNRMIYKALIVSFFFYLDLRVIIMKFYSLSFFISFMIIVLFHAIIVKEDNKTVAHHYNLPTHSPRENLLQ